MFKGTFVCNFGVSCILLVLTLLIQWLSLQFLQNKQKFTGFHWYEVYIQNMYNKLIYSTPVSLPHLYGW